MTRVLVTYLVTVSEACKLHIISLAYLLVFTLY